LPVVLVLEDEMDAGEQIALLLKTVIDGVPREFGIRENLRIGLETDGGAVLFGIANHFKSDSSSRRYGKNLIDFAFAVNRDDQPFRKSVCHRGADAMKTGAGR
jgi:hypothetical protein